MIIKRDDPLFYMTEATEWFTMRRHKFFNIAQQAMLDILCIEIDADVRAVYYDMNIDSFKVLLHNEKWMEVPEGHEIPTIEAMETPELYREKYEELVAQLKDHFDGGPIPEFLSEHLND